MVWKRPAAGGPHGWRMAGRCALDAIGGLERRSCAQRAEDDFPYLRRDHRASGTRVRAGAIVPRSRGL
jgi:hypothetical protein